MDIEQLDKKLINSPLSKKERINYIKIFLNKIYLQGIDKGTKLEQSRIKKIQFLKDRKFKLYFQNFSIFIEDLINISEKKIYREKYKGRYSYYKPKRKKKLKKNNQIEFKYKQSYLF